MLQKLISLARDFRKFIPIYRELRLMHVRPSNNNDNWLIFLPDSIGDVFIQIAFIKSVSKTKIVTLFSFSEHYYTELYTGIRTNTMPKFETRWAQKRLTAKIIELLAKPAPHCFIAATFDQPRLRELSTQIEAKSRFVYKGEAGHVLADSSDLESFSIIENPFDQPDEKLSKKHIYHHLEHLYQKVFGVNLSLEEYHDFYTNRGWDRKPIYELVGVIPQASVGYRDVPAVFWKKLQKQMNRRFVILGDQKRIDLSELDCIDYRGETTLDRAHTYLFLVGEIWSAENGLALMSFLNGIKTTVVLGGGHYGRFFPWVTPRDNLHVVHQSDTTCFNCNWDCEFETLGSEPAPCIRNIELEAQHFE